MGLITAYIIFQRILSLCPHLFRWYHKKMVKHSPMGVTGMDPEGFTWTYAKFLHGGCIQENVSGICLQEGQEKWQSS